ncbi:MAG: hypothetical protein GX256_04580 [Fretibacterium sp.]|nr:hypothetical protein [Fretibacterium sp.]
MNRKFVLCVIAAFFTLIFASMALAHTPLFTCWDNGDGTFTCEAGFSDGSSATSMPVRVTDDKGTVLEEGKVDETGEISFKRPEGDFSVVFDGGPGHTLTVKGSDIK